MNNVLVNVDISRVYPAFAKKEQTGSKVLPLPSFKGMWEGLPLSARVELFQTRDSFQLEWQEEKQLLLCLHFAELAEALTILSSWITFKQGGSLSPTPETNAHGLEGCFLLNLINHEDSRICLAEMASGIALEWNDTDWALPHGEVRKVLHFSFETLACAVDCLQKWVHFRKDKMAFRMRYEMQAALPYTVGDIVCEEIDGYVAYSSTQAVKEVRFYMVIGMDSRTLLLQQMQTDCRSFWYRALGPLELRAFALPERKAPLLPIFKTLYLDALKTSSQDEVRFSKWVGVPVLCSPM